VTDVRIVPNFTVGRIGTVNRVMAVFPVRDVWSLPQCEGQRRILPHLSTGSSPRADCGGQCGACGAIHGDRPAVSQWRVSPIHLFRRLQIRTVVVVRSVAAGAGREWPVGRLLSLVARVLPPVTISGQRLGNSRGRIAANLKYSLILLLIWG